MKCWLENSEPETGSTAGESESEVMETGLEAVVDLGEDVMVTPAAEEVEPARSRPEAEERFSVEEEGDSERSIRCCFISTQSLPAATKMEKKIFLSQIIYETGKVLRLLSSEHSRGKL